MNASKVQGQWAGFQAFVWDTDLKKVSSWQRRGILALRIIYSVVQDLAQGQLSLRAMSLVYTTVISLVPLLALCFSVLKGFGAHNQIRPALLNLLEPLGEKREEITEKIIQFVDNIQVGVLGALGLALLIYSVVAMMQKIERSFNYTWHVRRDRKFSQRFSDYLSVLLVGPLLIFLSIGITTSLHTNAVVEYLSNMMFLKEIIMLIGLIIPYLMMAAAFAFIYFYMPNTRVKIGSAFVGGLVTAVIWKTMGWAFASFVATSAKHTAIYSAFASVIIFMVWIYVGWLVLLVGATIAFYHQNPNSMLATNREMKLSNRAKEQMGLLIIYLIGKHYQERKPAWDVCGLANKLNLPDYLTQEKLDMLCDLGLLVQSKDTPTTYYPAVPLEQLEAVDVVRTIREAEDKECRDIQHMYHVKVVDQYFSSARQALEQKVGKVTVKDLINNK